MYKYGNNNKKNRQITTKQLQMQVNCLKNKSQFIRRRRSADDNWVPSQGAQRNNANKKTKNSTKHHNISTNMTIILVEQSVKKWYKNMKKYQQHCVEGLNNDIDMVDVRLCSFSTDKQRPQQKVGSFFRLTQLK